MIKGLNKNAVLMLVCGLAVGLSVGSGMLIGSLVTTAHHRASDMVIPDLSVYATASHGADTIAAATGPIDDDVEGLFTLDFLTGDLLCHVMYVKGGAGRQWGGRYKTNVLAHLPVEKTKKPNFIMVTGQSRFVGATSAARPGMSIVYVIDANTGIFAAYGLQWQSSMHSRGLPQVGALQLLNTGNARMVVIRE